MRTNKCITQATKNWHSFAPTFQKTTFATLIHFPTKFQMMLRKVPRSDSSAIQQSITWMKFIFSCKVGTFVYCREGKFDMIGSIENEYIYTITNLINSRNWRIGGSAVNMRWTVYSRDCSEKYKCEILHLKFWKLKKLKVIFICTFKLKRKNVFLDNI